MVTLLRTSRPTGNQDQLLIFKLLFQGVLKDTIHLSPVDGLERSKDATALELGDCSIQIFTRPSALVTRLTTVATEFLRKGPFSSRNTTHTMFAAKEQATISLKQEGLPQELVAEQNPAQLDSESEAKVFRATSYA